MICEAIIQFDQEIAQTLRNEFWYRTDVVRISLHFLIIFTEIMYCNYVIWCLENKMHILYTNIFKVYMYTYLYMCLYIYILTWKETVSRWICLYVTLFSSRFHGNSFSISNPMIEIDLIYKCNLIPCCNGERGGRWGSDKNKNTAWGKKEFVGSFESGSTRSVSINSVEILPSRETTRVGTWIVATIYLQLIQNRYMFRSFTVLQCSQQHYVQPIASDVEVVGYL